MTSLSDIVSDCVLDNTPIVAQARTFVKVAMNVTKATDPTSAVIEGIKTIVIDCSPPNIKYPLKCAILVGQVVLVFASLVGTPIATTAIAIATATQVLRR